MIELLGLGKNTSETMLDSALDEFTEAVTETFGKIIVSNTSESYCLDVPEKGCAYVCENVPEPVFLKKFLAVITAENGSLDQIRACFAAYAEENHMGYTESDRTILGMGHVFYFDENELDAYVYCVEADVFGLTYHRFTKAEYKSMVKDL